MVNEFDITIPNKIIVFERLGEPLKQNIIKPIKQKRKVRKIYLWSLLTQLLILLLIVIFIKEIFRFIFYGWLIAVIGFIIIPSIKRRKQKCQVN